MSENVGPIYEVTLSVDREIIDEFDAWLAQHVEEMLQIPGFVRASTFAAEDDDAGRPQRVTHYYLESEADLGNYLAGPAEVMRRSATERFAGRFSASRRVLHSANILDGALKPLESCLNCGTTLGGQYCGHCGQRSRSRLISIWELLQDAFGDLLELDSRLWQTLIPLVTRPGKLTRDYLEGRRARYMPPFRTYLVLSIVFFLVAFFDPGQELGILFEPEEYPQNSAEVGEEILREPSEEGIISLNQQPFFGQAGRQPLRHVGVCKIFNFTVVLALCHRDSEAAFFFIIVRAVVRVIFCGAPGRVVTVRLIEGNNPFLRGLA